MAGSVLNWTFGFQMNISAKLKVSASKSATSPSCRQRRAFALPPPPRRRQAAADLALSRWRHRRCRSSRRRLFPAIALLRGESPYIFHAAMKVELLLIKVWTKKNWKKEILKNVLFYSGHNKISIFLNVFWIGKFIRHIVYSWYRFMEKTWVI